MLFYFCSYLLTGALIGSLSGLLGIGGAIIGVPCLAWLFIKQGMGPTVYMHMAEGTSLAVVFITGFITMLFHHRRQVLIWPIYRKLVVGIIIGTVVGALVARGLSSHQLRVIFSLFIFAFGLYMLFNKQSIALRVLPSWYYLLPMSLIIGVTAGLLGVGGGILIIPLLTFYQIPLRQASAISASCACTVAVFGVASFIILGMQQTDLPPWSSGYVYWPAFAGMALASPLFAYLGVELAYCLPVYWLRRAFACLLLMIGLYMAFGFPL